MSSSWTLERARLANHHRYKPDQDDTDLRRNYAAARVEDYVRRTVAAAPPLTDEQRARIAAALLPADGDLANSGATPARERERHSA